MKDMETRTPGDKERREASNVVAEPFIGVQVVSSDSDSSIRANDLTV
jgi:hypothetical protein